MRRDDPLDDDTPRARAAPSLTAQIDREAAARAYRKVMSGQQPSASEQAALRRYEKQQEEQRQQGTASRILLSCRHCRAWVLPEREHLTGWKEAASQAEARERAVFLCPACAHPWTEPERIAANHQGKLVHDGEELSPEGLVQGRPRPTEMLGFRWSAVHNLFLNAGDLGADEWRASRSADEENAEREMRQFVWCLPITPSRWNETALSAEEITRRLGATGQGIVPVGAQHLTAAIDLGKYLCHWIVAAWSEGAVGHVVDYGRIEVASPELGVEKALLTALREFRDRVLAGWPTVGSQDSRRPESVWVDAGYMMEVVYRFCREAGAPFGPAFGRGTTQRRAPDVPIPGRSQVLHVGKATTWRCSRTSGCARRKWTPTTGRPGVHQRLTTPVGQPGALTLFQAPAHEHLSLAKHLTAERKTEEFVAGKGVVTRWERVRKSNHWLDALYNACAAGHLVGVRPLEPPTSAAPLRVSAPPRAPADLAGDRRAALAGDERAVLPAVRGWLSPAARSIHSTLMAPMPNVLLMTASARLREITSWLQHPISVADALGKVASRRADRSIDTSCRPQSSGTFWKSRLQASDTSPFPVQVRPGEA